MESQSVYSLNNITLSQRELRKFQELIYKWAGIHMSDAKSALIAGRLLKRLRHYGLKSYGQYLDIVLDPKNTEEIQVMINLLTTNETYFFREDSHLDYLHNVILPQVDHHYGTFRVWSAASSSGEEAYSISMVIAEKLHNWEVLGTDINEEVLNIAREAVYPIEAAQKIPQELLKKYCLKGVRSQDGKFAVMNSLKKHVTFQKLNLNEAFPEIGLFDIIFLRNVMIYFQTETKQKLIDRVINTLKKDGYLFVGHSESLHHLEHHLQMMLPTIYKKV